MTDLIIDTLPHAVRVHFFGYKKMTQCGYGDDRLSAYKDLIKTWQNNGREIPKHIEIEE